MWVRSSAQPLQREHLIRNAGWPRVRLLGFTTPWGWFVGIARFERASEGEP